MSNDLCDHRSCDEHLGGLQVFALTVLSIVNACLFCIVCVCVFTKTDFNRPNPGSANYDRHWASLNLWLTKLTLP